MTASQAPSWPKLGPPTSFHVVNHVQLTDNVRFTGLATLELAFDRWDVQVADGPTAVVQDTVTRQKWRCSRNLAYGSWSNSRSYAASRANERGASLGTQNAGGSWRSCTGQRPHVCCPTSTTAPRYFAPLAIDAVGVVSLSAMMFVDSEEIGGVEMLTKEPINARSRSCRVITAAVDCHVALAGPRICILPWAVAPVDVISLGGSRGTGVN